MAIPALIAAAMRLIGGLGGAGRVGLAGQPPPLPGAAGRGAWEFSKRMESLGGTFKDVNAQAAFAQYNVGKFGEHAAGASRKFAGLLTAYIDVLKGAAAPIESLVAGNNPAVAKQFDLAMRDAYGTLGQQLIPVLNSFTGAARKIGNVFAGMRGALDPAIQGLTRFVESLGGTFARVLIERAPLIEMIGTVFAKALDKMATAVDVLFKVFDRFVLGPATRLARLLGFGQFDKNANDTGAGIRSARKLGGATDISDEAIKNALMAGNAGGNPQVQAVSELTQIKNAAVNIYNWIIQHTPNVPTVGGAGQVAVQQAANPLSAAQALYALFRTS